MTTDIPKVSPCASAADAARVMAADEQSQGYVLVFAEGSPVGIVTEVDLVTKVLATGTTRRVLVTEIMSSPLIAIDLDEDLMRASTLMTTHHVRHLPVMRNAYLYGVLTENDVATKLQNYVDRCMRDLVLWTTPVTFA